MIIKLMVVMAMLFVASPAKADCYGVNSNWIEKICYYDGIVTVSFGSVTVRYCDVPRSLFDDWVLSDNASTFYYDHIKGRFSC